MAENLNNNPGSANVGEKKIEATQLSLTERVDKYYVEKNAWKNMNGGCAISADLEETLVRLRESVKPRQEDLPDLIRASIVKNVVPGETLEQIWAQKIAEGVNFVGVVDGSFGFYKGEQRIEMNNKPLSVSVVPMIFEYRDAERKKGIEKGKQAAMLAIKSKPDDGYVAGEGTRAQVGVI